MEKQVLQERLEEICPMLLQQVRARLLKTPCTLTIMDDSQARLGRVCIAEFDGAQVNIVRWYESALKDTTFPLQLGLEDAEQTRLPFATLHERQLLFV